jgi:paraquat-inducible protein B
MASLRTTADQVRSDLGPILGQVGTAVGTADQALRSIKARADDSRQILSEGDQAIVDFKNTLLTLQLLAKNANALIEPNSPFNYELVAALRDVAAAARSLNALAGSIERNPNAVIFGRVPPPAPEARRP